MSILGCLVLLRRRPESRSAVDKAGLVNTLMQKRFGIGAAKAEREERGISGF